MLDTKNLEFYNNFKNAAKKEKKRTGVLSHSMFKEAPSSGSAARLIQQTALDNHTIIKCLQNAGRSVNRMAEGQDGLTP